MTQTAIKKRKLLNSIKHDLQALRQLTGNNPEVAELHTRVKSLTI